MDALLLRLVSFTGTWEPKIRRWSIAYCPKDLMMCNTNNGTERMNEDLKYDELVGYKNCTLSELLQVFIENFLLKHYEKYIELNFKYTYGFRKYQQEIPKYWQNRPKWYYVLDLLEKQSRLTTYMIDLAKNIGNNKFHVSSKRNESLSQKKYILVMKVITVTAVVVLFGKIALHASTSLLLSKKS